MLHKTRTTKCKFILTLVVVLYVIYILYLYRINNHEIQNVIRHKEAANPYGTESDYYVEIEKNFMIDIDNIQSNCNNNRILMFKIFGDGFANIHHFIGQVLLVAISSNRRLYIYGNFKYYKECKNYPLSDNWQCIYDPINMCNESLATNRQIQSIIDKNKQKRQLKSEISLKSAWQQHLYNLYFGEARIVEYVMDSFFWLNGIFNQKWINKYDNVFIRSYIQYYIWLKMNIKTVNIINKHPLIKQIKSLKQNNGKYIAFHIRKSDNVKIIKRDFGVDANRLFTIEYYLSFVKERIDIYNEKELNTIFVCTDNNDIIYDIKTKYQNKTKWNFIYNQNVKRNTTSEWVWFLNNIEQNDLWNIIIDIELLRLADYLVGSPTSNVFRIGMELNYATHWTNNRDLKKQTIFSVDIPWMQDP